eukprot:2034884-Prymnesium_polylepis.1
MVSDAIFWLARVQRALCERNNRIPLNMKQQEAPAAGTPRFRAGAAIDTLTASTTHALKRQTSDACTPRSGAAVLIGAGWAAACACGCHHERRRVVSRD